MPDDTNPVPDMTGPWTPYPPAPRVDARRLVEGRGRFVANLAIPGLLHAGFVRSVEARGRIRSVDLSAVVEHPRVVAAFTADDLGLDDIASNVDGPGAIDGSAMTRPILARDLVQHVGDPVAVIVAEDPIVLADVLERAEVDIEPLPAYIDAASALAGEPLHPGTVSNLVTRTRIGDPETGWDNPAIDVEVDITVVNQRVAPVTLEPTAIAAAPESDTGVTRVHVAHQAPHLLKRQLARWFDDIEVIVGDVGGGYGLKARLYPEYVAVIAAARRFDRPVRWLQTRSEQLACGSHGRDMDHRVRLGATADGRIVRADIDFTLAVGAYPHLGAMVADFTRLVAQQLYDIGELSVTSQVVVTNTAPIAPYRGAGRPEAAYAMERAVDALARRLDLDPVGVRARNLLAPRTWPHVTHTGARYDSGDYRAALDHAVSRLDLISMRDRQVRQLRRYQSRTPGAGTATPLLGVGLAAWVERAGGRPDTGEYAKVEALADGRLIVLSGSCDSGQGHHTVWAQLAGRAFGFTASSVSERITVIEGDTERIPRGSGSSASRSAQIGGSAVHRCARRLVDHLRGVAANILEAAAADIEVEDGTFRVRGVPTATATLSEVVVEAGRLGVAVADEEWYVPGSQTFPYGVHAAVVEVDPDTGAVAVERYIAVDDCGVALNPDMVEGQTIGSIAQGIGQALFERVAYADTGQLLTGTLLDYGVPGSTDLPAVEATRIETPAPSNPLGAKGAGEGGCIGAPPAVVNAVLDALGPLGVEHLDMPLDPNTVWAALDAASHKPVDR